MGKLGGVSHRDVVKGESLWLVRSESGLHAEVEVSGGGYDGYTGRIPT